MKPRYLLLPLLMITKIAYSQKSSTIAYKPPLDTSIFTHWQSVTGPGINSNGSYATYTIENLPAEKSTLVILGIETTWKKQFINGKAPVFTGDSKKVIFSSNDSLLFLTLGTDSIVSIPNIYSYKTPVSGNNEWLAYQLKGAGNELILLNLFTGKDIHFPAINNYTFNENGKVLLLESNMISLDKSKQNNLQWVSLPNLNTYTIWRDSTNNTKILNRVFNNDATQLTFMVSEIKDSVISCSIWHYMAGMENAIRLVKEQTNEVPNDLQIKKADLKFSENGKWIFFRLQDRSLTTAPAVNNSKVDVWSYKDIVLQSEQLLSVNTPKYYEATVNINGRHLVQITKENEQLVATGNGNHVIISDSRHSSTFWWNNIPNNYYLLSLENQERKLITKGGNISATKEGRIPHISISPENKYVIYFDGKLNKYFSYEISSNITRNISNAIPARLDIINDAISPTEAFAVGLAGWLKKDSAVLIYDNYDIWLVDPLNKFKPVNITNNYGKLNKTQLRLVYEKEALKGLSINDSILLGGFNTINKHNGFFRKALNKKGDPELLVMGPHLLDHQLSISFPYDEDPGMHPIKAKNENIWIVSKQTASEAPNFYITKDLKHYTALSNIVPHKNYNWLTTELITWKQLDGTLSQGILYKPENFDSLKKYPVIFNYYEKMSSRLYNYLKPAYTDSKINIPYFVSKGYLVFTPDIHYTIAKTSGKVNGDNLYNSIVSAAQFLSKKPWVDAKRMGIQGHSFGGQETNYLISHTNLFAAAAEAAGTSDMISTYLSIAWPMGNYGGDRQHITEVTQGRMWVHLWERPDLYLKASPVLQADKVTTPLLIMHNIADDAVPWSQAVEMYMALRRLGKKVWMLQYDNGDHSVFGKDAIDYTTRLTQFFDHYLKGAPAPIWMTKGIPAKLKSIETGFELDQQGSCGKGCLICKDGKNENRK